MNHTLAPNKVSITDDDNDDVHHPLDPVQEGGFGFLDHVPFGDVRDE